MVSGRLDAYAHELAYSKLKIQVLEERLRLQRIEKYGPSSEKLSSLQLELLEQEPGVSREEVVAESQRLSPPPASERKKRPHPGRQALPADLPRVERVIACTPEQCVCGNCGRDTTFIGYEVSEVLNVEPARYFVEVTKREKRACKTCPEQGVMAAPLPNRIIDKSLVSDEVIINTVVNKYCDYSPLYRQSVSLLRDAGIDISRATMCGWVMAIGEMLMPVVGAMRSQLLAGTYIQADETPVDVQTHDCGDSRPGLLTADMDPVASADGDGPHGVLGEVVAEFQFRIIEEADQPFPYAQRVGAALAGSALGQDRLAHLLDVSADLSQQRRSFFVAQSVAGSVVHVFVARLGIDREQLIDQFHRT